MALTLKDTCTKGARPGVNTVGAIVLKLLRLRFDAKNPSDLKVASGWDYIMLALGLAAGDERRMIEAEHERQSEARGAPAERIARLEAYVKERLDTCTAMHMVADLGYDIATARTLWWTGGDYQRYAAVKQSALRRIEDLRKLIDDLPLDTRR